MARLLKILVVLVIVVAGLPPLAVRFGGWDRRHRSLLPERGNSVDIGNGLFLNVYDVGQGSPVVFVHGLPSCASDWGTVPKQLAARGRRAISYDRVGYGFSSRPEPEPERYTYRSNARELAALLDALGIDKIALVGWSYGGAVVQTFAVMFPERVTQLILVASVGPSFQPRGGVLGSLIRSPAGEFALDWVAAIPPLARATTRGALREAFGQHASVPLGWVDYMNSMLALPQTRRSYVLETIRGHSACLLPERIDAPTLILQGTADTLVPPQVAKDVERAIRGSELVLLEKAGHMLPVTHADVLVQHIDRWLRSGSHDQGSGRNTGDAQPR